ncbi:MAG: hypothetical protein ACETWQ_14120 [Phycisphaerae bacterium]
MTTIRTRHRAGMMDDMTAVHTSSLHSASPHRWALKTSRPAVFSFWYSYDLWFLNDRQPLQETLASGLQWR